MDSETTAPVISKTKSLSRQSRLGKNSKLVLMPWEKRHQHTLTSFVRKNSMCKNLTENCGQRRDNLMMETNSSTKNGDLHAEDHTYLRSTSFENTTTKEESCNNLNEDVLMSVEDLHLACGGTHKPIVSQELDDNILKLDGKSHGKGNGNASTCEAINANKVIKSTYCDSDTDEVLQHIIYDSDASIISKDEFDTTLNKALSRSHQYRLDEVFKYDKGEDKDLLWQAFDF